MDLFPQNLLNLPIAMLEVSSSLHTLLGWGGEVGRGGAGTGKGDFLFRNGRRVFLVIKASIVWE